MKQKLYISISLIFFLTQIQAPSKEQNKKDIMKFETLSNNEIQQRLALGEIIPPTHTMYIDSSGVSQPLILLAGRSAARFVPVDKHGNFVHRNKNGKLTFKSKL